MNRRRKQILLACRAVVSQRRRVLALVLVVVLVPVCAFLLLRGPPDPIYDGKPLSYWLAQPSQDAIFLRGSVITLSLPTAHHVDTNALPLLLVALQRGDDTDYNFRQFIWTNSSAWLQRRLAKPTPAALVRLNAATMLIQLGDKASPALPALIQTLEHNPNPQVRCSVVDVLAVIGKDDPATVKALINAAKNDPDASVRAAARNFLLRLNPERTRRVESLPPLKSARADSRRLLQLE